jgi:hypothetical protein
VSLIRAELRRLFLRRLAHWMLAGLVLVLALVLITSWFTNQQAGPATLRQAEEMAQQDYEEQRRYFEESLPAEIDRCEQAKAAGGEEARFWPEDCQELAGFGPRREDFRAEWYMRPTFEFRTAFGSTITVFSGLLAMFGFLVGASFVGAEWRSGGMMNLLLWRPRRVQVLGAKLAALLGVLVGVGVLLGGLWTAGFWLVATYRGITATMTPGAWQSFALTGTRGLTLALVAGVVGFTLASLGRHTAMALGAAVAALVVGVVGVGIAVSVAGVAYPEAWLWPVYLQAWMDRSATLQNFESCGFSFGGGCEPETLVITWQASGIGMAVLVAVLVGAAMWHMRRRDVT